MIEMSMWDFRVFSNPGFHFCFHIFRSVGLNKFPERCLNAIALRLSCMWAWPMLTCLGLLGQFLCQEVGSQSV